MTWQACDQKLRTAGHVYFDCPNYVEFAKNAVPNTISSDEPSSASFTAGSSSHSALSPAGDIEAPPSIENILAQSDSEMFL